MAGLHCDPAALHMAVPLPESGGIQHPPSRQKLPGQHGSPLPPQAAQVMDTGDVLVWQSVWGAVQDEFVQQVPLVPPQVPQAPFEQVPESGLAQVLPLAVQKPDAQHPLFKQALPAQQICPGPPQVVGASAASTAIALSPPAALSRMSGLLSGEGAALASPGTSSATSMTCGVSPKATLSMDPVSAGCGATPSSATATSESATATSGKGATSGGGRTGSSRDASISNALPPSATIAGPSLACPAVSQTSALAKAASAGATGRSDDALASGLAETLSLPESNEQPTKPVAATRRSHGFPAKRLDDQHLSFMASSSTLRQIPRFLPPRATR